MVNIMKKTKDEYISSFINKHGSKYDYSHVVNIESSKDKITILCHEHGKFIQSVNGHSNGNGCYECGVLTRIKNRMEKTKLKKDKFIDDANKFHDFKYDYSKVDYINMKTLITIICPEHGEFKCSPMNHLKHACKKCKTVKLDKQDIFYRFKIKHKNKYDYSLSKNISNTKDKISIICPIHGVFKQSPELHFKHGCKRCSSKGGYSEEFFKLNSEMKNKPALLYIIKCYDNKESFYKIGITTTSISKRYGGKSKIPYDYELIYEYKSNLYDCFKIEQSTIINFKNKKYIPKKQFGGMYECIKLDSELNKFLQVLKGE